MAETTINGQLTDRQRMNLNALALQSDLRDAVRGEVRFDAGTRAVYAHDSSNYRQVPFGVVIPKDADDVVEAVKVCARHGAPVLPRGCGTSLSGETTNVAVVIDTSKYMREILEVNPEEGYARVQPGVIRDQLSLMTEQEYNLTFAPDTSTHAYATFGGMIGNNSCGVHSVMAGRTSDNVYELDIVLHDGTRMTVGETSEEEFERIVAGEHGDGQQRAQFLPKMYGEELMRAFGEFKEIWDPDWKMNPGKVVDANPMTSDLRLDLRRTIVDLVESEGFHEYFDPASGRGGTAQVSFPGRRPCSSTC